MTHPYWPIFDLTISTRRLDLRPVRETDIGDLIELAGQGIHDPADMPFLVPFTDEPSPFRERHSAQFYWGNWATWSAENWRLALVVRMDGRCVGTQDAAAKEFPVVRTASTGSWLGREFQGMGLGTEMRAGILAFLFGPLGAARAETGAFEDNAASLGVTRSFPYRANGWEWSERRGERGRVLRYALDAADWSPRDDIRIDGVSGDLLDQFGLHGSTS